MSTSTLCFTKSDNLSVGEGQALCISALVFTRQEGLANGVSSTGKDLCMLILQIRAFSPPELYGLYVVNSHKGGEGSLGHPRTPPPPLATPLPNQLAELSHLKLFFPISPGTYFSDLEKIIVAELQFWNIETDLPFLYVTLVSLKILQFDN